MSYAEIRAREVAAELEAANHLFAEGERGLLQLWLDHPMGYGDVLALVNRTHGRAYKLISAHFDTSENRLDLHFEARIFWLPIIAIVLGLGGFGIWAWQLSKTTEPGQLVKSIAIPTAIMFAGATAMGLSGGKWPGMLAGGALMAGGGYLAWQQLRPVIKAGFRNLTAVHWSEWLGQRKEGLLLPVVEGAPFGAAMRFEHLGSEETASVGLWADIEGRMVWAGPVEVLLAEDSDWKGYDVEVEGVMELGELAVCRRVDTVLSVSAPSAKLEERQKGVYHIVPAEAKFRSPMAAVSSSNFRA